ncbi:MAG: Ycf66 family protein [Cyanobacteria bacterium]|nr:Ycf66 family protein [Cyanobacteriota bacterium]
MLATVGGTLALLLGLLLLLLPLLATELSRPRDSVWGAVVLLLGLVLVTSADRLTGAPMLAVLCGGLLIGRLGSEVGQARWRQLTDEERQLLVSSERWNRSVQQLTASFSTLLTQASVLVSNLGGRLPSRPHQQQTLGAARTAGDGQPSEAGQPRGTAGGDGASGSA